MKGKANCECCTYYYFDEEYGYYICQMNLDEDEMSKFLRSSFDDCPYFHFCDEYMTVRKQN